MVKRPAVTSFDDKIWKLTVEIKRLTGFAQPDVNCIVELEIKGHHYKTKPPVLENKDLKYNDNFIL